MPQRRLIVLCALLAAAPDLSAQLPRGGDLGKRWKAKEWTPSFNLQGYWVRRGNSNEFDASYTDSRTRQNIFWRLAILSVDGSQVRIRAALNTGGTPRTFEFTARLLSDGRTIRGRGGWCGPNVSYCGFEAVADWSVAAREDTHFSHPAPLRGRDTSAAAATPPPSGAPAPTLKGLPPRWRVKDNSIPGFAYQGTWTIQGRELRYNYSTASGDKAEGSMALENWDGAMLILHNRGAKRFYRGLLQPGGKTVRGTTSPCPPRMACTWEASAEK